MNNSSIIDSINYSNKPLILSMADHCLSPLRIVCNKQVIDPERTTKGKTYHIGLRVIAALAMVLAFPVTLPVTLAALAIKWWKKEEWQSALKRNSKSMEPKPKSQEEATPKGTQKGTSLPDKPEEFAECIEKELTCCKHLDPKLSAPTPGSWRAFGKEHNEKNQLFGDYTARITENCAAQSTDWPDHRPLHIQKLGSFSDTDLKIIGITCDYLQIFHNVSINLSNTNLTMEQLKDTFLEKLETDKKNCRTQEEAEKAKNRHNYYTQFLMKDSFPREDGQYGADVACELMRNVLLPEVENDSEKNGQILAFTNKDLFTRQLRNFVFGCGSSDTGIWSNCRFGDPTLGTKAFQTCLLRMMKITTHEFGHMRGLPHCTDYECNIGGYMNLTELDDRPLLFCLQDMAKICYLTHTSLLEQHQKILNFFQKFNTTYQLECDFSKEIQVLKNRISVLSSCAFTGS